MSADENKALIHRYLAALSERVAVRATVRGQHKGEFMGAPPTGKPVSLP